MAGEDLPGYTCCFLYSEMSGEPGEMNPKEPDANNPSDGAARRTHNDRLDDSPLKETVPDTMALTERVEAEERIRFQARLLDVVGQAVIATDPQGKVIYWNRAAEELYGWSQEEATGRSIMEVTPSGEMREKAEEIMSELLAGRSWSGEFEVRRKDNTTFPAMVTDAPVHDEQGNLVAIIGVSTDITELKQTEERSRQARNAALRADVSAALAEGGTLRSILQRCTECMVRHLNAAFARIWTLDKEENVLELLASAGIYTHLDGPHGRVPVGEYKIGLIAQERLPLLTNDVTNDPRISDREWAEREGMVAFAGYPLVVEGRVVGVMAMFAREPLEEDAVEALASVADVIAQGIERKVAEERFQHQAFHDPLTGLPNRQLFDDRLKQALGRTRRKKGSRVAVLFMDLDNFKAVNDSLGHEVGDRLLVVVAERLRGGLRPEDTLARFGGDEFTVLLEDVEGSKEAVWVAERIVEGLEGPFVVDEREFFVRASIGVALGNSFTKSPQEILRDADTAMYEAKEAGLDHRVFDTAMHKRVSDRLGLENDIRRAIEREEFRLFYQPKVRLGKEVDRIAEVEALLRWEHPRRGLLMPDEFIPLAEEAGLIIRIGRWVLKETCRQVRSGRIYTPRPRRSSPA